MSKELLKTAFDKMKNMSCCSLQLIKIKSGVYFDCAEPTARMLRASLAEDESHLHGRLSQVKFDNTSVC